MPVSDWNDLCPQTIVWESMSSRDQYGKPSYAAPVTFRGRRVYKNTRVKAYERGTKGQGPELISESQIWILGTPNVGYEDKVYVSGDPAATIPPILSIERTPDETGDLFVKVLLGSANG